MAHQLDDLARGLAAGTLSRRTAIWRLVVGTAAAAMATLLPAATQAAAAPKVDLNGTTINGCLINGVCINGTNVKEIKDASKEIQKQLKEAGEKEAAKALKEATKDVIKEIKQGDGGVIPPS